jgi:hypothetical protein
VKVDHDPQRFGGAATHHLLEQFPSHLFTSTLQHEPSNFVEDVLGIEHQAVEVEDDSADGRRIWELGIGIWDFFSHCRGVFTSRLLLTDDP